MSSLSRRKRWRQHSGEVGEFTIIRCEISSEFCVRKLTKIGSFFAELFKIQKGVFFATLCRDNYH